MSVNRDPCGQRPCGQKSSSTIESIAFGLEFRLSILIRRPYAEFILICLRLSNTFWTKHLRHSDYYNRVRRLASFVRRPSQSERLGVFRERFDPGSPNFTTHPNRSIGHVMLLATSRRKLSRKNGPKCRLTASGQVSRERFKWGSPNFEGLYASQTCRK